MRRAGFDEKQIAANEEVKTLKSKTHETSGRVGGLTTQRNRRQKELAALKKGSAVFAGGRDGVVAVVRHGSTPIAFTRPFGGVRTGDNLALAAARVANGPTDAIIGEEALRKLAGRMHVPGAAADSVVWLLESLNIAGGKIRDLERDYGPIGAYLSKAVKTLGLEPPLLTETRPALTSVDSVLTDGSDLYGAIKKASAITGELEAKVGVDILPPDFSF